MKIVIVLSNAPGYSETFFRSKIKGLQRHGHEVLLATAKKDMQFDLCEQVIHPKIYKNKALQLVMMFKVFLNLCMYYKSVYAYYKLERNEQTSFKRILEKVYFNASLLKLKVDWLHFGFATMALERELVGKAIGAKIGVSFRGFDINVYPLKHLNCYNTLWKYVHAVHSISLDLWKKGCELGLSPSMPYQIIPPAVDAGIVLKSIEDKQIHDSVEILTIARLHYIKGIDILINTAKILNDSGVNFKWRIVGSGDSQSLKRYKYHIFSLGLEDIVLLEGKKSHEDSLKLLEDSDLYVQTSYTEGFCNALLEAQAKGILCIAFNSGGIPENIIHNETGFLVDSFSEKALAKQVKEALVLTPEAKIKITQQAINRVRADFTLEKQQQAFLSFFSTII